MKHDQGLTTNTLMCSVESETLWNVLATASLTVAELRPGSGKKQLRRATPANPSGVGKPQRSARLMRSRRRSWARRMLLDGGYGERRSKLAAEQSRRGNGRNDGGNEAIYSRDELARLRQRTTEVPRRQ